MSNKVSGIYQIVNLVNGKKYVGSAVNLNSRKRTHFSNLRLNKHCNNHLQNAWNKYEENNFKFEVIEYVENKIKLIEKEQYWIDKLNVCNDKFGYNIAPKAGSQLGFKHSEKTLKKFLKRNNGWYGKHHTEKTKIKISKANKGRIKSKEEKLKISLGHKGLIMSEEHKKALSKSHIGLSTGEKNGQAKLNESQVIEIKLLLKEGIKSSELAKKYNVQKSTISDIKNGHRWKNVILEGEPEVCSNIRKSKIRLEEKQVIEIKKLLKQGVEGKKIAKRYNVSPSTITYIKKGITWRNVILKDDVV